MGRRAKACGRSPLSAIRPAGTGGTRAAVPDDNITDLASTLAARLLKTLGATVPAATADRAAEARRFCREAQNLRQLHDPAAALAAAEAAYALDGSDRHNIRVLSSTLQESAFHLICLLKPTGRQVADAYGQALRALDVHRAGYRLGATAGSPLVEYSTREPYVDDQLLHEICRRSAEPADRLPADARQAVHAFREEYHRYLLTKLTPWASDSSQGGEVFESFSDAWVQGHYPRPLLNAASNSREYYADLSAVMSRWLESWQKLGNFPPTPHELMHLNLMLRFFILDGPPPEHYRLLPEDSAALRPLLASMRQHAVPLVQDYGTWGEIWLAQQCGGSAPTLDEFKTLVHKHIENPAVERRAVNGRADEPSPGGRRRYGGAPRLPSRLTDPAEDLRWRHYVALCDALRFLTLDKTQRRQERIDLLNYMLDRHEMVAAVINAVFPMSVTSRQEAERALASVQRVQAALDGIAAGSGPRPPGYLVIGPALASQRQQVEAAWPDLVHNTTEAPWQEARLLVRHDDVSHDGGLVGPVACDDQLLVAAAGSGREAFSVPLSGGPGRSLGKLLDRRTVDDPPLLWYNALSAAGGGNYFLAGDGDGILVFSLSGGPPRRIDQSTTLPSNRVSAMAWLDGKLYAVLDRGAYLIGWDPAGVPCEVLASPFRKERQSPLDDIPRYSIAYLAADPPRHRLLLTIRFSIGDRPHRQDHGLWQYVPADKTFSRVLQVNGAWLQTCGGTRPCQDAVLLWFYSNQVVRVDLKTDKASLLYGWASRSDVSKLDAHTALYPAFPEALSPYAETDGWLWTAHRCFARVSQNRGLVQRLPSLTPGEPNRQGVMYDYLERIGKSQLLAGDQRLMAADPQGQRASMM